MKVASSFFGKKQDPNASVQILFKSVKVSFLTLILSSLIIAKEVRAQAGTGIDSVAGQFLVKFSHRNTTSAVRSKLRSRMGVSLVKADSLTGTQLVQEKTSGFDHRYAKELLASGDVEYIEPNYIVSVNATPNDSSYNSLWGMHNSGQTGGTADVDIDAPEAWNLTTGSSNIVVGVVDTGIDYNHPDLTNNMWRNPGETAGNNVDDDHNGVVDDVYGYNAISPASQPFDDNRHGTHCAGTIGGVGNNSTGVAGVNWSVKLMALKFLSSSGSGSISDAVSAINYAVQMKQAGVNLRVLSNSWGGGGYSQTLQNAITAANSAGILFVAAAGNDASDTDSYATYPAGYDVANVISVAAIDHNGNLATFSNYGATSVDLAAPGVSILSTTPGNTYSSFNGTSMATPHVSGVAALVLAREPTLTVSDLKSRLLNTVKQLPSLVGLMRSPGTVSAYNALTNSTTLPPESNISYSKSAIGFAYDSALGQRILNVDDGYSAQDLGFSFSYYGTSYTRIAVSANGRLVPLVAGQSTPTSADYSNRLSAISPFNDDLYPSNSADSGVWFKTNGSNATITWVVTTYAQRLAGSAAAELRFQAQLFSNGKIEFHYLDTNAGDSAYSYGASASVGIAPMSGDNGKITITHNAANEAEIGNNKAVSFTPSASKVRADFDADGVSDLVVWRPSTGMWYINYSGQGFDASKAASYQLGLPGDTPLLGDFDGDGRSDIAIWRPSTGDWQMKKSGNNYGSMTQIQWGLSNDMPLTGDFDGDGKTDIAVYRQDVGFYILRASSEFNRQAALTGNTSALISVPFYGTGNNPYSGDFNGDGKDQLAIVWQLVRFWTIKRSSGEFLWSRPWGMPGDTPIVCDRDADGKADRLMVRLTPEETFIWYGAFAQGGAEVTDFGLYRDVPLCQDFDGDGKGDMTLFRPSTGQWYIKSSQNNSLINYSFGLTGDVPL